MLKRISVEISRLTYVTIDRHRTRAADIYECNQAVLPLTAIGRKLLIETDYAVSALLALGIAGIQLEAQSRSKAEAWPPKMNAAGNPDRVPRQWNQEPHSLSRPWRASMMPLMIRW